jgi:hypothetical protein
LNDSLKWKDVYNWVVYVWCINKNKIKMKKNCSQMFMTTLALNNFSMFLWWKIVSFCVCPFKHFWKRINWIFLELKKGLFCEKSIEIGTQMSPVLWFSYKIKIIMKKTYLTYL